MVVIAFRSVIIIHFLPLHSCHLIVELGSKVSGYVKNTRVKQVMADLALAHVSNQGVEQLTQSEYRRLVIGTQLVTFSID